MAAELVTYPGHPLQPAALIAASCTAREVAVAPPDVDQKVCYTRMHTLLHAHDEIVCVKHNARMHGCIRRSPC